jgi:membrane protease YdiL (CAAX protease family)
MDVIKEENKVPNTQIGKQLQTNRVFIIGEIVLLFAIGIGFIKLVAPLVGENLLYQQLVVWFANILLLTYVWIGLKLRNEGWKDFGLTVRYISWSEGFKGFLITLLVAVLGLGAFVLGGIIMASFTSIPENIDVSGYDYLKDNVGMLILSLGLIYIVSSFGEEVIYRAFLINRITKLIGKQTKKTAFIAVILSSIIFGLVHYEWGPMGIVQTGCMALVMGSFYIILKKRLWILVLAHAYMDTLLMVQVYLASN